MLACILLSAVQDSEAASRRNSRHNTAQSQKSGEYCSVSQRCAYMMFDASSGAILAAKDIDKRVHPASLTKLMTAYMALEAIQNRRIGFSDRVFISSHAASQPALKIGFRPGQSVSIEDLLEALTVKSANDAAVALAEAIGGSESGFARRMTQKAHQLGMNRTTFMNASGLPDDAQLTTARDMVTLAARFLTDFPRYRHYFSMTQARVGSSTIEGHNHMLKRGEIDGGKTGYIQNSGFNLVAWARRDGRLLIGAVFGGRTYATRDAKMLQLIQSARAGSRQLYANTQQENAEQPSANSTSRPAEPGWKSALPSRRPSDQIAGLINQTPSAPVTHTQLGASTPPAPRITYTLPANVKEADISASAPPPSFQTSWAIQVGAYKDSGQAMQALDVATRLIPTILGAAYPRTLPTSTTVGVLHRAQMIGLNEREAKAACAVLSHKGMQCLPMPPTG